MNRSLFFASLLCLSFLPTILSGQAVLSDAANTSMDEGWRFAAAVTAGDIEQHLTVLASAEMEGRETGTEGQAKAAAYIEEWFRSLGLPPISPDGGYQQPFTFTAERWEKGQPVLTVNGTEYKHLSDYVAFPSANAHREPVMTEEIVFLGYGIDAPAYSDYAGQDVRGKTILIYLDEPVGRRGKSFVTGSRKRSDWSGNWRKKVETAFRYGVATVLIIDPDIKATVAAARTDLLNGQLKMGEGDHPEEKYANSILLSSTLAKVLVGDGFDRFVSLRDQIRRKGRPASLVLPARMELSQRKSVRQVAGTNVLGYIEGVDPQLKSEVVVLSAHYDHLGKRGASIYHGADDNGSGSSTVLDIAEAFAQAKASGAGPKRSVLCLLVSGEEKGLLGSAYYADHPVFPLDRTVADVNVDMVGRTDKAHQDNPDYIYVIGSDRLSSELHAINEAANAGYVNIALDYTFNAEDDPNRFYYRSDHYNFAQKGIPSIFYFSGVHDDYHQPSDTVDKIMFPKMEKIGRLIFLTTWELANRPTRIRVDVDQQHTPAGSSK
ncbi:MAG: hypothetical protein RLY31_722 [Bacteroidota bacterium]